MLFLNKLLLGIKNDFHIFKNEKVNYILGLTNSQMKELKKFALENEFISQKKQEFFLTKKGEIYLESHPIVSWNNEDFPKRPNLNLEYMKIEKTPATVTKAIRNLAKHLLDGEELKPDSVEDCIKQEILSENSNFKDLKIETEKLFSQDKRVNISDLYKLFVSYGLTKSVISVLLLDFLSKNKDKLAVYEKYQFELRITQLLFDKMMFAPENFELQKTVFEQSSVLEDISVLLLPKKSNNILEITKGLIIFIRNLEKYTLNTERLSEKAIKLRNAVINAKEPINLLTVDIPRIIQGKKLKDCDDEFYSIFENTLNELKNAVNNMVQEINNFTLKAFICKDRKELSDRFKNIEEYIGSQEMKTLYSNITNEDVSDKFWIERIATYVNKFRVPKDWSDEDVADYKVKIKELALKFHTLEATVGSEQITITSEFNSLLDTFFKLSKSERFIFLRKAVNE